MAADIDGIDAESGGVFIRRLDAVFRPDMGVNGGERFRREGRRIIKQLAVLKRTEAGVEVIEAVGGKFESDHVPAERVGDHGQRILGGALAVTDPEEAAIPV